jgi:hypothetical protein
MGHPIDEKGSKDADLVRSERYSYVKKNTEFPAKFDSLTAKNIKFEPLKLQDKPAIANLPSSFLEHNYYNEMWLFQQFFNDKVVQILVDCTNKNAIKKQAQAQIDYPQVRIRKFEPVNNKEILSWLGIILWMSIHPNPGLQDHWSSDDLGHTCIKKSMSYARWRAIYSYIHCNPAQFEPTIPSTAKSKSGEAWYRPHEKVEPIAELIRQKAIELMTPSTHIAIDECIAGFSGRTSDTVIIKSKPTPEGFKLWCIASFGYIYSFMFHVPGQQKGAGPQGLRREQWNKEITPPMAPTHLIILELASRLHDCGRGHCIWMDNLFTTQQVLSELRKRGIGGAGTVRTSGNTTDREAKFAKEVAKETALAIRHAALVKRIAKKEAARVAKYTARIERQKLAAAKKHSCLCKSLIITLCYRRKVIEEDTTMVLDSQATLVDSGSQLQFQGQSTLIEAVATATPEPNLIEAITPSSDVVAEIDSANGLHPLLQELKLKWQNQLIWGAFFATTGSDKSVLQFAWKDSAVVLFMTTVNVATAITSAMRKKPANLPAYQVASWGASFSCLQDIPAAIDDYNHYMNGVDIADQRRAAYHFNHRCHRTWHPLFHWLREMVIVNCNILWNKSGKRSGKKRETSLLFRQRLSQQLMRLTTDYSYIERARVLKRKADKLEELQVLEEDSYDVPKCPNSPQYLKKRKYCVACSGDSRISSSNVFRKPLAELSANSLQGRRCEDKVARARPPRSRYGCPICKLHLCRTDECWKNHLEKFAN